MALLTIVSDEQSLAERVADRFVDLASNAIRERGVAAICLTGGSTPRRTYDLLATPGWQSRLAWDRVRLYWTDERQVAPDHPDSNYGMAHDALLRHVPIPPAQVHRIRGEVPGDEAALLYERELPESFHLTLLGVGADAHIASLFPGSPLLFERVRRAAAASAPNAAAQRVTLTPPTLLASEHILVIVAGTTKAAAVAAAFDAPTDVPHFPVHLLREAGDRVEWFIDRAAARDVASRRE